MRVSLTVLLGAMTVAITACDSPTAPTGRDETAAATQSLRNVQVAGGWSGGCRTGDTLIPVGPGNEYDANNDLSICSSGTEYYDNRIPNEPDGGGWDGGCRSGDTLIFTGPDTFQDVDRNGDYAVCSTGTRYYDNKLEGGSGGEGGGWIGGCRAGDTLIFTGPDTFQDVDKNGDYAVCSTGTRYYDNKLEGGNGGDGGGWEGGCRVGDTLVFVGFPNEYDENGDLAICSGSKGYYDNRL